MRPVTEPCPRCRQPIVLVPGYGYAFCSKCRKVLLVLNPAQESVQIASEFGMVVSDEDTANTTGG